AADDYAAANAADPDAFDKGALGRLFDRLFAGQAPKSGKITSSALPDIAPTSPAAPTAAPAPPQKAAGAPALSSGQGLLDRILKSAGGPPTHTAQGDPLVPGTAMTTAQFLDTMKKAFQASVPPPTIPGMGQTGDLGRMGMPQPSAMYAPRDPRYGGQTFGGQQFGGNTFGGNTFGGHQFGASAPGMSPAGGAVNGGMNVAGGATAAPPVQIGGARSPLSPLSPQMRMLIAAGGD